MDDEATSRREKWQTSASEMERSESPKENILRNSRWLPCSNRFLDFSTIIPQMTEIGMPFTAELQNATISIWLATTGLVGLGLLLTMKSPVVRR